MIELLATFQPLLLLGMLIGMYSLENIRPYLAQPANRKRHDCRNFALTFISLVTNGIMGIIVLTVIELTAKNQWGLMNAISLPLAAEVILSILLLDLGSYLTHHLQHKVPLLWRFHRIHHSDPHLNSSSSLRFHPVDVVISQCLYQCLAVALLGVSMTSFIIYGTITLPLIVLQHSNVKLPDWFEKYARLMLSTPGWHKIHHSADQRQTDSHYGDVFTFWDRIFGTWHSIEPHQIRYGLDEFSQEEHHRIGYLMGAPFKNGVKHTAEKPRTGR